MNFTRLLVLMGLMGAVISVPISLSDCELTNRLHHQDFVHISELQNSSVAPWILQVDFKKDREPENIQKAVCQSCSIENMIAEPIKIRISVYQRVRSDDSSGNSSSWYKCPFELAVGCTCVRKQTQ